MEHRTAVAAFAGERISANDRMDVISPNMFAGSILDLEPNTAYEVRLTLSDPDGVSGETIKERDGTHHGPSRCRTPAAGCFTCIRRDISGPKLSPSFEGLMCAYNYTCAGTDWATAGRPRVQPGDTILVHAGLYKYNRYEYTNNPLVNRTQPLDGTYYLTADGTDGYADRHQRGRRWRSDLRRKRQLRGVRCAGCGLHVL